MAQTSAPRAVAIILGPLGVSRSQLEHYASWYRQRSCVSITSGSPPLRFLCNASLQPTAASVWEETLQVLRETPPEVPLVIHMFSNGGCFVWEAMDRLLDSPPSSSLTTTTTTDEKKDPWPGLSTPDRELLRTRLKSGYLMFDSCPCYIRTVWDTATPWSDSFPFPGWTSFGRTTYTAVAALSLTTWLTCTLAWSRPKLFWEQMTRSTSCLHHVYVYTTADVASDATAVDRLVEKRREANLGTTVQHRYQDSNHCRIDKDHPEEYQHMIDQALEAAIARAVEASKNS